MRGVRDVVDDADREVVLRLTLRELVEDGLGHRRIELLRGEAVASADHPRHHREGAGRDPLGERRHDVLVQRLARRARLLRPVEHGDRPHGGRERPGECLRGERPEEPDVHDADLLAAGDERVDGLLDGADARAHQHHDPLGVGRPVVVEQVVGTAGELREPVHRRLHDLRDDRVEGVRRLAGLEEDVGVLGGPAEHRVVGGEGALSMRPDEVVVDEVAQHLVRERTDHVHLVRGPKAVEEVQERHAALERGRVGDRGEVLGSLHVGRGEHRPAGRPHRHHVALVAEDGERVGRERPRRDVDHGRRELAGDLVHVGDHQQEALRRRERRAQRAGLKGPVQRPGRAALALHLDHLRDRAPQVRSSGGGPGVRELAHRGGRRDRIDGDDLRQPVRDARGRLVPVDRDQRPVLIHVNPIPSRERRKAEVSPPASIVPRRSPRGPGPFGPSRAGRSALLARITKTSRMTSRSTLVQKHILELGSGTMREAPFGLGSGRRRRPTGPRSRVHESASTSGRPSRTPSGRDLRP